MTTEAIRARIAEIRRHSDRGDDDSAHAGEDDLHLDVLRFLAAEAPEPYAELARVALETTALDFARHCA